MSYKRACVYCRTVVDRRSNFCPHCGRGQPFERELKPVQPKQRRRAEAPAKIIKRRKTP